MPGPRNKLWGPGTRHMEAAQDFVPYLATRVEKGFKCINVIGSTVTVFAVKAWINDTFEAPRDNSE